MNRIGLLLLLALWAPAALADEPTYAGTLTPGLTGKVTVKEALSCAEGGFLLSLETQGPFSLEWPSGRWLDLQTSGYSDSLLVRFDAKGKALWALHARGPAAEWPTNLLALSEGQVCWTGVAYKGLTLDSYRKESRQPVQWGRVKAKSTFVLRLDAEGKLLASTHLFGASLTALAPAGKGLVLLGVSERSQGELAGKTKTFTFAPRKWGMRPFLAVLDEDLDATLATPISTGSGKADLAVVSSDAIYLALDVEGEARFKGPLGKASPPYRTEEGQEGCIVGPISDPFLAKFDLATGELHWSAQLASPGSDYLLGFRQHGNRLYLAIHGHREIEYLRGKQDLASFRADKDGALFSVDLEGQDPSCVGFERPFSANVEILAPKRVLLWGSASKPFSIGDRSIRQHGLLDAFLLEQDLDSGRVLRFAGLGTRSVEMGVGVLGGQKLRLLTQVREGLRITAPAKPLASD
jgi:hypothetical protein